MKSHVTVTVLKPFEYQGQHYTAGQAIALSAVDAIVMSRKRVVTLSKRKAMAPDPEPVEPEPQPDPEPPKRRTYKRRDMQAEHTTALEPEPQPIATEPSDSLVADPDL